MTDRQLAKVIADSISPHGVRLTTMEIQLPRIVLAEFNTHRQFSRNSASSRAIPIETMLQRVVLDPYIPETWERNGKGMQGHGELDDVNECVDAWLHARDKAVDSTRQLLALGVHKGTTNRLLEPFMWHTIIVTATEWSNFFHLRCSPLAHPAIRNTAEAMRTAMACSSPLLLDYGQWHLPYINDRDSDLSESDKIKVSTARCARVSYLTHDGVRDPSKDIELHDSLVTHGHMCYDDKTEVLTSVGWKAWPAVQPTDELCAVDITDQTCRFEKPEALHAFDVDEPLYHVFGQQIDLKVTQNHRMVTSYRHRDNTWTPFAFETAEAVQGRPRRYLKSAVKNEPETPVPLPFEGVSRRNFFRFLGFFIGDGYAVYGNQAHFHLRRQRKIDYLMSLEMPVVVGANDTYKVTLPDLGRWCSENCYDTTRKKKIPEWVLLLGADDASAVLDGLRASDGSTRRNTWVYATTSQQVADMLQAILHTTGQVGSFTYTAYGDSGVAIRVNVSTRTTPRVEIQQSGRAISYADANVQYKGIVYCATTSTGALMVRRNGHVAVSGNSPLEHIARPMTRDDVFTALHNFSGVKQVDKMVCEPDEHFAGNLRGWVQYRKTIAGEADILTAKKTAC